MAFETTIRAQQAAARIVKQPNLVLCIDGIDTKFGAVSLLEVIRIGDPGLFIDGSWVIGGFREIDDQLSALSMDNSTTTIKQQLDIDKGRGSSISSMELGLIDFGGEISRVISPGVVVEDVLGRKAMVYLGFADNTSFPEDYIVVFRGIVDDIKADQGIVKLNIAHPDQKKRQRVYPLINTQLNGAIDSSQTTITVDGTDGFLVRTSGPDGTPDSSFTSYIRIEDEIIQYTNVTGTQFTGCTRGALGTVAVAHDDEADVDSFYRLQGNSIDLALKLMLSGWQGPYVEDLEVTSFNYIGDGSTVPNTIFFSGINIETNHGIVVGDYITTTGSAVGANNVSVMEVVNVTVDEFGSYIEVDGVSFVDELDSAAVMAIRSQYDTLPNGFMMSGDEVDIAEHHRVKTLFLASFDYDFYLKDSIESGTEFLEQQIYKPAGSYSLPRKARASVGYFVGPLPNASSILINETNITNPDKLKIRRTINKNFFNTIVYKYEVDPIEDKFLRGKITQSADSLDRIPVGTRALVIEAQGMRTALSGANNATIASNRRIDRFRFGSEFLEGVDITYEYGYNIEIGDIIILDGENLNLLDSSTGEREKPAKFFEIINKSLNIKTGKVTLDILDTSFEGFNKYGLIGPSSRIKSGFSQTQFLIEEHFNSPFGAAEYKKWERYPGVRVKVRSSDFTTRFAQTFITGISGNTITVADNLGFTPQPGDIMELSDYDFTGVTEQVRLLYVHISPLLGGADDPYLQL